MFSVIFPGQGSQMIGMGKEFYQKFDLVKSLFKDEACSLQLELPGHKSSWYGFSFLVKNGKRDGLGIFYYLRNDKFKGDKYIGQYKNSKKHGKGNYIFKNGNEYIGGYKDGKRYGQGIEYAADGTVLREGPWE